MPKVSIHTVSKDNAKYLPCAVRSIAAEPIKDFEWLFLDDNSKDASLEVLDRELLKFPELKARTKILHSSSTSGIAAGRQNLLETCSAEYSLALDGDDALIPGSIQERVEILDSRKDVAGIYGKLRYVSEDGSDLELSYGRPFSRFLLPHENMIPNGGNLLRCSDAIEAGGFKTVSESQRAEDLFLWIRLSFRKDFLFQNRFVYFYRTRPGQLSGEKTVEEGNTLKVALAKAVLNERPDLYKWLTAGGAGAPNSAADCKAAVSIIGALLDFVPQDSPECGKLFDLAELMAPDDYGIPLRLHQKALELRQYDEAEKSLALLEKRFLSVPGLELTIRNMRAQNSFRMMLEMPEPGKELFKYARC